MKKNVFLVIVTGMFLLISASPSVRAQEKPSPGKKTTHIRTVTVKDGKEEIVDTVYTGEDVIIHRPGMRPGRRMAARPVRPSAPFYPGQQITMMNMRNPNVINLADPGIISYKKKKLSGGREKITIIRNEVKEAEGETFQFQVGNDDDELKKMNAPRVVRELEIQKKDQRNPGNVEKKIEIKTK